MVAPGDLRRGVIAERGPEGVRAGSDHDVRHRELLRQLSADRRVQGENND